MIALSATLSSCGGGASTTANDPHKEKIEALMAEMTFEEKIGQLNLISNPYISTGAGATSDHNADIDAQIKNGSVGNFLNVMGAEETYRLQKIATEESRLGIPLLFGYDVIHGYKTMFPVPLADAASFDREAIELSSRHTTIEAAAAGLNWTYAPMIDVSRDARWGRIMEGAGEDVYLTTEAGLARIKGIQGTSLAENNTIAACAKHFIGYGAAVAGRDYASTDIPERVLRDVYFPPFKAAAEAGVASFMSSFNTVNGEPASGSKWLMTDILRDEWGYEGFVVSDWASIAETIAHGTSANELEAAYNGLNAGIDMDMCGYLYTNKAKELVESGRVDQKQIDDMVYRVLKTKFDLGLFDDPFKYSSVEREKEVMLSKEAHEASREVAKKSIVLMKNEENILPLSKKIRRIAVIGPLANDKDTPLGNWRGMATSNTAVSLLEGIKAAVAPGTEVIYAKGCDLTTTPTETHNFFTDLEIETKDRSGFAAAVRAARSADVVIMAVGETAYMSGECRSYADINLKGLQKELLEEIAKVGKPTVMALFTGRPLVLTDVVDTSDAILNCWLLGSESGNAIADVLFGDYNPSGKLPAAFPYHVGQLPMTYTELNTGRPYHDAPLSFSSKYRDVPNTPLFAFGHGLSYTQFDYKNIALSSDKLSAGGELKIDVTVNNSGKYDGNEIVQLYVRDMVGNGVARPLIELKGFEKVFIKKGESTTVSFTLTPEDIAFYRLDKTFAPEAGDFEVYAGGSSNNLKLTGKFSYTE